MTHQITPLYLKEIFNYRRTKRNMIRQAYLIEATLKAFGLTVQIVEINPDPTEIVFLAKPLNSTDTTKIINLDKDLAIALASPTGTIKMTTPISGKDLIGIHLPRIDKIGYDVYNYREANKPPKVGLINKVLARWCLNWSEKIFRRIEAKYGPITNFFTNSDLQS